MNKTLLQQGITIPKASMMLASMMYNKNGKIKLNYGKRPIVMRRGDSNNNKKKNNRAPPRMSLFDRDLTETYDNTSTERTQEQENNLSNLHRNLQSITFGNKTVLAVRVVKNRDISYDYTSDELSNYVFGTNGKPLTLKSQYTACSYGSLNFESMGNRTMVNDPDDATTNIIGGIVTVKVSTPITSDLSDTEDDFERDVTQKLNQVFGVDSPEELADHVMYCLPKQTMDGENYCTLLTLFVTSSHSYTSCFL